MGTTIQVSSLGIGSGFRFPFLSRFQVTTSDWHRPGYTQPVAVPIDTPDEQARNTATAEFRPACAPPSPLPCGAGRRARSCRATPPARACAAPCGRRRNASLRSLFRRRAWRDVNCLLREGSAPTLAGYAFMPPRISAYRICWGSRYRPRGPKPGRRGPC